MTRKPTKRELLQSDLSPAMDHAWIVCDGPAVYAPYCSMREGWLVGYDGIVAAGHRITQDLPIAPHTETIRAALARVAGAYSLTVSHELEIVVTGSHVRVKVPCMALVSMPYCAPDHPRHLVDERLRHALIQVGKIAVNRSQLVHEASVLLRANTCVASNGSTILEGHHGNELAGQWLLPKEFVDAISKVKHEPSHLGWSDDTLTIWFGQDRWIRTNVYQDTYPDSDIVFARLKSTSSELRPIPQKLLVALETLKPFRDEPTILLASYGINTKADNTGAHYAFEHYLEGPRVIPYDGAWYAATHGQYLAFGPEGFYWYGQVLRGVTAAKLDNVP